MEMGIPYTDPGLPIVENREPVFIYDTYKHTDPNRVLPVPVAPDTPLPAEPELEFNDRVQVSFRILKNGTVRVKVNAAIASLHEKYYKQLKQPPLKVIIQAYKAHGFSQTFLDTIKVNYEKKVAYTKQIGKIFEGIFERSKPVQKRKKKPEEPEEHEESDEEPDLEEPDLEDLDEEEPEPEPEPEPEEEETVFDYE